MSVDRIGRADRKEAIRQFKERVVARGVFALRCLASNQIWVGTAPDLDARRNAIFFQLRHGAHRDRALQAAWTAHGHAAFQFEILETLDEDTSPLLVKDLLTQKSKDWLTRLGALPLLP
jgi:hypothetical protein